MDLEQGDYFVVTRGFNYSRAGFTLGPFSVPPLDKPQYDRSLNETVFLAEEVAGPIVCARIIVVNENRASEYRRPGKACIINLTEVEVMTVSATFVDRLTHQQEAPAATERGPDA